MLFIIPGMRLVNETNAREHWAVRSRRAKLQRETARLIIQTLVHPLGVVLPLIIIITRTGPRKLDSDNLAASAKHVRDGIADALKVNDGDESKVIWVYKQERGPWGVRVGVVDGHD